MTTALVVGSVLAFTNHGPALLRGEWTIERGVQIGLTFLVPFAVSSYSAYQARQDFLRRGVSREATRQDRSTNRDE